MVNEAIIDECKQIINESLSGNNDSQNAIDLVQNFPNEFFATLLSQSPLNNSHLSLIKVVLLSLEGDFKLSAQSAFCDTFSVVDFPFEDVATNTRSKLDKNVGLSQEEVHSLKSQLEDVINQRKPLYDLAKALISESYLSTTMLSQRIGVTGLYELGVISDPILHMRREARANTSAIYRQHRFNLHREVAEGFSKLTALIINFMGNGDQVSIERTEEYVNAENERARHCWKGIEKLIGFFDLDPLRALSTILDLFASSIATHYHFFIALLDCSPWKRNLNVQQNAMETEYQPGRYENMDFKSIIDDAEKGHRQPINTENNNNSSIEGSLVITQVLGFMMRYYQRPQSEPIPELLYHLCALLIRENYISLLDLLPHLSPDDKVLADLKNIYKDNLQDKLMSAKSSNNKLAMAAPLSDDMPPNSKSGAIQDDEKVDDKASKEKEQKKFEPPLQKVGLLVSLLAVGALKESFILLSLYPHIAFVQPKIMDLLIRIAEYSIEPVYAPISTRTKRNILPMIGRLKYYSCDAPPFVPSDNREVYFYYEKWSECIPQAHTIKECLNLLNIYLSYIGPCSSRNVVFFNKILRIAANEVSKSDDLNPWIEMTRLYFFPALSLSKPSSTLSSAMWNIIKHFPLSTRYQLYGEMRGSILKRIPEVRVKVLETERDAKSILRRLSSNKALVKAHGRSIAKISHSNPVALFTTVLQQVQSYENIAQPVIDGTRYISHLSYDVFTYSLLDFFTDPAKERTKLDGTNASLWLQSLATFAGGLYRRQAVLMDPTPVLTYVAHELKRSHVKDLIIFRELVKEMSSILPLSDLSDAQIVALSAGKALKMEAIPKPTEKLIKKSSPKLRLSLHLSNLTIPLLILIAQQLQVCVYMVPENEAHPKHLSTLYDETLGVLLQYIDFLKSTPPGPGDPWLKYEDSLPSFEDLVSKFGLDIGIAFTLLRSKISSEIYAYEKEKRLREEKIKEEKLKVEEEKKKSEDEKMKSEENKDENEVMENKDEDNVENENVDNKKGEHENVNDVKKEDNEDVQMDSQTDNNDETLIESTLTDNKDNNENESDEDKMNVDLPEQQTLNVNENEINDNNVWHPKLLSFIDQMKNVLSEKLKQAVSPAFITTFWQLSMYDISVPLDRYGQEIKSLQNQAQSREWQMIDKETGKSKASTVPARVEALRGDMHEHMKVFEAVKRRIAVEKQHWFSNEMTTIKRNQATNCYIQFCIMPRVVLSPEDALYCARFSKLMHSQGVPSFPTLLFLDKIFSESPSSILSSSTENESRNYSRFLTELLSEVSNWHKDEKSYLDGARGTGSQPLHGFRKSWDVNNTEILSYEEFKKAFSKWRVKLLNAFTSCVKSGEYMHVRNAVIVYNRISEYFPDNNNAGERMYSMVNSLVADEKRDDLKILAQGYLAQLSKRRHTWGGGDKTEKPVAVPPSSKATENKGDSPRTSERSHENSANNKTTATSTTSATATISKPQTGSSSYDNRVDSRGDSKGDNRIDSRARVADSRNDGRRESSKESSDNNTRGRKEPSNVNRNDRYEPVQSQSIQSRFEAGRSTLPPKPPTNVTRQISNDRPSQHSQPPRSPSLASRENATRRMNHPPSPSRSSSPQPSQAAGQGIKGRAGNSNTSSLLTRMEAPSSDQDKDDRRSKYSGRSSRDRSPSPKSRRRYDNDTYSQRRKHEEEEDRYRNRNRIDDSRKRSHDDYNRQNPGGGASIKRPRPDQPPGRNFESALGDLRSNDDKEPRRRRGQSREREREIGREERRQQRTRNR